jgi:hypothetical protein
MEQRVVPRMVGESRANIVAVQAPGHVRLQRLAGAARPHPILDVLPVAQRVRPLRLVAHLTHPRRPHLVGNPERA